ncbi:NADPH-dependent F420 reductase [Nonomuraea glycinis]|uniref:NADPH-dependent F420 reductase n=1 Tax=Nonomuraea glycinis TaxID=2047744 RepID=UPI0033BF939D
MGQTPDEREHRKIEKKEPIRSSIGTGNMARVLAGRALAGGNAVEVIGRDASKADALVGSIGGGATTGRIGTAPAGDIVILALPYADAAPVVRQLGNALSGKVIVDITNPFNPNLTGLVTPEGSSAAQEIAKAAPAGAHVVKAFNTVLKTPTSGTRPRSVALAAEKNPPSNFISLPSGHRGSTR